MPCSQRTTLTNQTGFTISPSSGGYATEADCLQACKEGACCEGATCTVKPQCQCQGTGKTFKGVGTTCSPNPCCKPLAGLNQVVVSINGVDSSFLQVGRLNVQGDWVYTVQQSFEPFASLSGSHSLSANQDGTWAFEYAQDLIGNTSALKLTPGQRWSLELMSWRYAYKIIQPYTQPDMLALSQMKKLGPSEQYGPYNDIVGGLPLYKVTGRITEQNRTERYYSPPSSVYGPLVFSFSQPTCLPFSATFTFGGTAGVATMVGGVMSTPENGRAFLVDTGSYNVSSITVVLDASNNPLP